MLVSLEATQKQLGLLEFSKTDSQLEFTFGLLEHEVQHHGQLIRFVYGNGLSFPDSWNKRYTV